MMRVERIGRERLRAPRSFLSAAPIRHLDPTLVLCAFALTAFGDLMVYSSSRANSGSQFYSMLKVSIMSDQSEARKPVATWRKVLAAVLDFIFAFVIAGFAVAYLTGNLTKDGFDLNGGPALIVFGAIAIYFVAFSRFLGGTPWQRMLGIR